MTDSLRRRASLSEHQPLLSSTCTAASYEDGPHIDTSGHNAAQDSVRGRLRRELTTRQVSMIAIGGRLLQHMGYALKEYSTYHVLCSGTIGTGLFLGTGRSLAEGGPASILICYASVGFVVYVTLLLLGEMGTQYPVAGECRTCRIVLNHLHWSDAFDVATRE